MDASKMLFEVCDFCVTMRERYGTNHCPICGGRGFLPTGLTLWQVNRALKVSDQLAGGRDNEAIATMWGNVT